MRLRDCALLGGLALGASALAAGASAQRIDVPSAVTAGAAFTVSWSGGGKGTLYIVGPAQVLQRDVQSGASATIARGELHNAGHYLVVFSDGSNTQTGSFDVLPAAAPASLGFLAKPSRLPVNVHNGISGAVYVFDTYRNLITTPMPATLELTGAEGATLTRTVTTNRGLAWTSIDSAAKESAARFTARVGGVSSTRIINQVPGDPCSISISATPKGSRLEVQTAPVRDCSGNMIPDGTIVTFIETSGGIQTTVDVPLKQGVASVSMPAVRGVKISAASGVVAGNEIRWGGGQ